MKANSTNGNRAKQAQRPLRDPWLVAAWPGMGTVGAGAASYLIEQLQPEPAGMIPEHEFFSVDSVRVENGIARSGPLPRSMFFLWRDPEGRRDLILFLGEAQPDSRGYAMCHRILDYAIERGVKRVVTFAAMATQRGPEARPRVFGTVTVPNLLDELRSSGVHLLKEGRVGGLNGALLAAAAERNVDAMCLLGELPFFAAALPNPKSSLAVVEASRSLMGVDVDLTRLETLAEESEAQMQELLGQLQQRAEQQGLADVLENLEFGDEPDEPEHEPPIDPHTSDRIEKLFGEASRDRSRATELKQELDRHGVFDEYEDRFLDLFREAG